MTVQIGIIVGKKSIVVWLSKYIWMPAVLQTHESLLLQCMPYVLDWVAAPDLPLLDHSPGRHNRIRGNNTALLKDSPLHDNWVVTHINSVLQVAGVQSTVVLDNIVPLESQLSPKSSRGRSCGMQHTIIANADVLSEPILLIEYVILLMSPRMTLPCQMAIWSPIQMSPTTVALGATKIPPWW